MPAPLIAEEETADGACFGRTGTRPRTNIRAGTVPEAVRPKVAAFPIAERSELRGESRRAVYGRIEAVRNKGDGLLRERQRLG